MKTSQLEDGDGDEAPAAPAGGRRGAVRAAARRQPARAPRAPGGPDHRARRRARRAGRAAQRGPRQRPPTAAASPGSRYCARPRATSWRSPRADRRRASCSRRCSELADGELRRPAGRAAASGAARAGAPAAAARPRRVLAARAARCAASARCVVSRSGRRAGRGRRGSTSTRSSPAARGRGACGSTRRSRCARAQLAATAAAPAGAEAEIFAAQALLLDDASIIEPARAAIAAGEPAARAFQRASEAVAEPSTGSTTPICGRARSTSATSRTACWRRSPAPRRRARRPSPGSSSPTSSRRARSRSLDPERAWGIATARGGTLDHAAIVAGALGIPYVVGLGAALLAVAEGTTLAVDGDAGVVEVEPDAASAAAFEQRREAAAGCAPARWSARRAGRAGRRPAHRGVRQHRQRADAELAVAQGAEGVGLLRTEFLYLDRAKPPSEDEQVAALTEIARRLDGRPLIVRTLDAGADKPLPFIANEPEANPFLGKRGLRLSLAHRSCSRRSCARSCAWRPSTPCR